MFMKIYYMRGDSLNTLVIICTQLENKLLIYFSMKFAGHNFYDNEVILTF